jgi:hypothetical protein
MKISRTAAFTALATIRCNSTNAEKVYVVRRLNKDGSVERTRMTAACWQMSAFMHAGEASKRAADLEAMNPGSKYVVCQKTAIGWFVLGTETRVNIA